MEKFGRKLVEIVENLSMNQKISTLKKLQITGWAFIFNGLVL